MVHTIRTVSELRRLLPQFDWNTMEYDSTGTMRVSDSSSGAQYEVAEDVWRSPSSPLRRTQSETVSR